MVRVGLEHGTVRTGTGPKAALSATEPPAWSIVNCFWYPSKWIQTKQSQIVLFPRFCWKPFEMNPYKRLSCFSCFSWFLVCLATTRSLIATLPLPAWKPGYIAGLWGPLYCTFLYIGSLYFIGENFSFVGFIHITPEVAFIFM